MASTKETSAKKKTGSKKTSKKTHVAENDLTSLTAAEDNTIVEDVKDTHVEPTLETPETTETNVDEDTCVEKDNVDERDNCSIKKVTAEELKNFDFDKIVDAPVKQEDIIIPVKKEETHEKHVTVVKPLFPQSRYTRKTIVKKYH